MSYLQRERWGRSTQGGGWMFTSNKINKGQCRERVLGGVLGIMIGLSNKSKGRRND